MAGHAATMTATPATPVASTFGPAAGHAATDGSSAVLGWETTSSPVGRLSQPTSAATMTPVSNGYLRENLAWSTAQPAVNVSVTYGQPNGFSTTARQVPDIVVQARSRMGLVSDSVLDELSTDSALWQGRSWDGTVTIPVFPPDSAAGAAAPTDPTVRQDPQRSPAFADRLAVLGMAAGLWGGAGVVIARKRRSESPSLARKPLESGLN